MDAPAHGAPMFSYFLPKYLRQGQDLLKDARKLLAYKRDLWTVETVAAYEGQLDRLKNALKARNRAEIDESGKELDSICAKNLPPVRDAAMRENVEVFLVAIVIALGVRTYFLQPFTIPTASMQPTLNGIRGYRTTEPPPNFLVQMVQKVVFGRSWVEAVATKDTEIVGLEGFKSMGFGTRFGLFDRTEIQTTAGTYVVPGAPGTVGKDLVTGFGRLYKAGEPIARGYIDTGDHVFVDKMSYHFRQPRRGEVFVFNTQKLRTPDNQRNPAAMMSSRGPSQFYIKRLAGVPGDELRIAPPELFVNGARAVEEPFQRVMSVRDGYNGYSNNPAGGGMFSFLNSPKATYTMGPKEYFALGDNSFHSSDSRDWGVVPKRNLMGHGVFVYWPFGSHWGFIK